MSYRDRLRHQMQLARLGRQIATGPVKALDKARAKYGIDTLGELEQQHQVAISGTAVAELAWADVDITFDIEFVNATSQRLSNLTLPHFTYGAVVDSATPVLVTAVVRSWDIDSRDVISGCTVSIGVMNPAGAQAYSGYLHLSFQGYGAPPEGDPADLT